MDDKLISECLEILMGDGNLKNLSEDISAEYLYKDVLKFQEVEREDEEKN